MKILITGGHFSPAYAIISELRKRGHTIAVAGRRYPFEGDRSESLEYRLCKKENLEFHEIKAGRFQRKFTSYTAVSLLRTPSGFLKSLAIISKVRPDVVMTFGGYIGLPIAYGAFFMRIPVVLHEQTQGAGLASRAISFVAKKVCVSFKDSSKYFPIKKTIYTGDPIRREVLSIKEKISVPKGKLIYVTGGSTGSHFINSIILEIANELLDHFVLVHQAGESLKYDDFEKLSKLRESLPEEKKKKYVLRKFIFPEEVGSVFEQASLILSRAGVNTVFEIMATKKISLLIPLSHGQTSEQLENAKLIKSLGIGEYIEENVATANTVLAKIYEMLKDEQKYNSNMDKTEEFVVRDSPQKIADIIEKIRE